MKTALIVIVSIVIGAIIGILLFMNWFLNKKQ